jgi:hypothetical protein
MSSDTLSWTILSAFLHTETVIQPANDFIFAGRIFIFYNSRIFNKTKKLMFKIADCKNHIIVLEEDYIFSLGPGLKPVSLSVLLSLSIKLCIIQMVHFGGR